MCTDLLITAEKAEDGGKIAVVARSLEFVRDIKSEMKFFSKEQTFHGVNRDWKIQFSYVSIGATQFSQREGDGNPTYFSTDGMNDQGFSAGALWFDGFAYYKTEPTDKSVNVANFVDYLLGNFRTVDEVLLAVSTDQLSIWSTPEHLLAAPLHFSVHDARGVCGVIEFSKEGVYAKQNHALVLTNSPPFEWHLNNLGYYASLTPVSPTIKVGPDTWPKAGMGAGNRGIPGDCFPASRFVRSFYYLKFANENKPPTTHEEAVNLGIHLMNGVDITLGTNMGFVADPGKVGGLGCTYYIVIKNLVKGKLYYRTYDSYGFAFVDLNTIDWANAHNKVIPLNVVPAVEVKI